LSGGEGRGTLSKGTAEAAISPMEVGRCSACFTESLRQELKSVCEMSKGREGKDQGPGEGMSQFQRVSVMEGIQQVRRSKLEP
jgi:hypothetical protein